MNDSNNGSFIWHAPAGFSYSLRRASLLLTRWSGVLLGAVLVFAVPEAMAQDGPVIEEILVTAQKREQSLQETPVSVTVFTQESIEARLMGNVADLTFFTPNVEVNNGRADGGGSNAAIFVRGVGQFDFIFPTDPGVGVYLDGVYMGRTLGGMLDLTDLQRVEVLRGPQGTLYGKNTIAGALNLVTAKPTGEYGGNFKITGGRLDRIEGSLIVDFPIVRDKLHGKVSLKTESRDGFGESMIDGRDFDDRDRQIARALFNWLASDDVDVLFSVDYSTWRQNGSMSHLVGVFPSVFREQIFNGIVGAPFVPPPAGFAPATIFDERFISRDIYKTNASGPVLDEGDVWGAALTVVWDVAEKLQTKSITSWREMDVHMGSDLDNTPFDFAQTDQRQDQNQLSQEFQFSGLAADDRLDWLTGAYYFRERGSDVNFVEFGRDILPALETYPAALVPLVPGSTCPPVAPTDVCAGGAGNPINLLLDLNLVPLTDIDTESYAVFAHGIFSVSEKLKFSVGARWTNEEKEWFINSYHPFQRQFAIDNPGHPITAPPPFGFGDGTAVPAQTLNQDWSEVTGKVGVEYSFTDDLMVYGSWSRGFKSGGWNPRMFDDSDMRSYDPERLNSFELGYKSNWLDRRLTLNGAFFLYDYEDLQLSTLSPASSPTNVVLTVQNAGEVSIKGFELELFARPTANLDAQIGVGYQTNEYDELAPTVLWSINNELPDAPEWTVNAGVQYTHPFLGNGNLTWRADGSFKSKTYKDPENNEDIAQGDLFLVNAMIAFETLNERWRFTLFGTNLTDKEYITRGLHFQAFGFTSHYAGRPREWGVSATYNF